MKDSSRRILWLPLVLALVGALFCFWITLGNELTFCQTAGCSLYEDATLGGISLWYYGMGTFLAAAVMALLGSCRVGTWFCGICLAVDCLLLTLMIFTVPCTACLTVAVLFAGLYAAYRKESQSDGSKSSFGHSSAHSRSRLLLCWGLLWLMAMVQVAKGEMGSWAMQGKEDEAAVHIYVSPSCSSCAKALRVFSGNIEVAFYPVAEKPEEVAMVARALELRAQGQPLHLAMAQAFKEAPKAGFWANCSPSRLLLRWRLLRNQAHVLGAGSQVVPFIEYRGLPSAVAKEADAMEVAKLRKEAEAAMQDAHQAKPAPHTDSLLPLNPLISGACSGASPCPE
jgi:hypothetical protein